MQTQEGNNKMDLTLEEILMDVLMAKKHLAGLYDQFIKEASNVTLLDMLLDHYTAIIDTQHALFLEMKERNFYPVENAEKEKTQQALTTLKEDCKNYSKDFK